MTDRDCDNANHVAIIGMSGRFPGASSVEQLWRNLCAGVESISFFSRDELVAAGVDPLLLDHPSYVPAKGVLDDADCFDAAFFGYSPRDAQIMDPQQRVFLECAFAALEDAGYDAERYDGRIGVYGGAGWNSYLLHNLFANPAFVASVGDLQPFVHGNDKDYLTSRVSYKLNLSGPSVTVQSACSTSLVAVCLAYQSLLNGECDIALAGGVFVTVPLKAGYRYYEGGILSPDGHCRAFDARAGGTVFGDGAGIVVLKRLREAIADGDSIRAVIRGSAVNNDGSGKVSYTAPSVDGQAKVIAEAIAMAGVPPETISYVEAHGTGTPMGDPIEVAGLTKAFGSGDNARAACAIGSVKTNIGHLDAAAGVTGLIKTALALQHRRLPPTLNFERSNPEAGLERSPFYVNTRLTEWRTGDTPRRAGVSSFGVGGTNAHVVLEEAPPRPPAAASRDCQLLLLSARTAAALDAATAALARHLREDGAESLADVAYTLQAGRRTFAHRRAIVCENRADAIAALETPDPKRVRSGRQDPGHRPVAFMFSGQGAQYVNMGRGLYRSERIFREQVDGCAEILKPLLGLDLRDILYPSADREAAAEAELAQTAITQPAIFVIEHALSRLWLEWGATPQAVIGHSIGEFAAACLAGVFSLEDALALVATRGRLMQALPAGAMLAVPLPEKEIVALLGDELSLASSNGEGLAVVAGRREAIDALDAELRGRGVDCTRLRTSHAFHSRMMEPMLDAFGERARQVHFRPPRIPYVSCVTGDWATAAEVTDPGYWVRHIRQTVRFGDGVAKLFADPSQILLEVGPGQTLTTLARQNRQRKRQQPLFSSLRHPQDVRSDLQVLLGTLGGLWIAGMEVDWPGFYREERRSRVQLPTYPFERTRHWVAAPPPAADRSGRAADAGPAAAPPIAVAGAGSATAARDATDDGLTPAQQTITAIWRDVLGLERIAVDDDFFAVGGNSLSAAQVLARVRDTFGVRIPLAGFFDRPSIAGLADWVQRAAADRPAGRPDADAVRAARDRLGL